MLFFSFVLASLGPLASAYNQNSGGYSVASYSQPALGYGYDNGHGAIAVAVRSAHNTEFYNVDSSPSYATPTNLFLSSQSAPVNMMFQTLPGPINVNHVYAKSPGSFRVTESTEEPHRFVHTVRRPVVQEVREIIAPIRFVRQEIRPVEESIQTVVARNSAFAGATGGGGGDGAGLGAANVNTNVGVADSGTSSLAGPGTGTGFGFPFSSAFRGRNRFGKSSRNFVPQQTAELVTNNHSPVGDSVLNTSADAIPIQVMEEVINVGVIGPRGCGGATNPGCKSIPYYGS